MSASTDVPRRAGRYTCSRKITLVNELQCVPLEVGKRLYSLTRNHTYVYLNNSTYNTLKRELIL
jgi:hypothetical protein